MRTTLDIDDDVLQAAKEHARGAKALHGFRPFPKRGGIVTNELIDKLRVSVEAIKGAKAKDVVTL